MGAVWNLIYAEYLRQLAARPEQDQVTQVRVAAGGGTRQNNVSRLPKTKRGPTVEIFVKILLGNGINPSDFFAAFESQLPRPADQPAWSRVPSLRPPTEEEIIIAIGRAVMHGYPAELTEILAALEAPTKRRP